ncbi:MAG: response regulator [Rhizomicrobium sp.]|jgi:PAS domain S-box-containing protein
MGVLAAGAAALHDIFEHGHLTFLSPYVLGALGLIGIVLLFCEVVIARARARASAQSETESRTLTAKLEDSLATVSAMNARLHEGEARYKGLVDSQGDAIFRRLPDSRLTYANDSFFRLFGLQPAQTIGHAFAPELHPDSHGSMFGAFAGLETGKARVKYDQHLRTAYGWRWIAWEDYAVRNASGGLIEVQSVGRDITERKALEDALTEARDKAEAASRAKSGFLATMSHEIRTPMNGVLGMVRLLLESGVAPEQRTYAEAIKQSGESLLALIEDILDFSKIESGTMTLEEDEVDLRAVVEGVVELLTPRAHAKGIEVVSVIAPDAPQIIRADALRLRQIFINLVGNAVKFTERGGVRIDALVTEQRGRHVLRFEVRDTGVGVPAEKRADIFKEFVQADSSHARKFGGSGLGLAICKKLVNAMDGEIGVDAARGGGSVFWFTIPAIVVREATPAEAFCLANSRLAIVTRNTVLREALTAQIRAASGEVAPLVSGEMGNGRELSAVLIDAGTGDLPELPAWPDGKLRSIVLLTPGARSKLPELKALGFSAYLVKPVRQASLAERLLAQPGMTHVVAGSQRHGDFSQSRPPETPRRRPAAGYKILLAEDNPINAMLTRELLKRRGHSVSEVTSGDAAVAAVTRERFDLVLSDIHMPGLDGVEAARRIRAEERMMSRPRVPIVALTADAEENVRQACQEAGMDGFLTKPIDPAELDSMFAKIFAGDTPARSAA